MSDTAIKIENLKKQYKLGAIGGQTLNAELQSWWARKRGKEDPNLKIGQDYSKFGERFYALDGINLEIKKGEALGIIGGNGAGKSTLLKILSRVTAPTEGDVWIDGRVASMLEVGTGFHGELTGRENIYMNGAILGMTRKEVDEKIESIIDFSECRQFIDTPVKRYSSGMYVKLAFAVASHLDAEIMIMDEVLAVGDMKFQQKCLGKMEDAAGNYGKTILYVSHNMSTIRSLCNRCVVLDKGKLVFVGSVDKAIELYLDNLSTQIVNRVDLENSKRGEANRTKTVHIKTLIFNGKRGGFFYPGDKGRFLVEVKFNEDVEGLSLVWQVMRADKTRIGASYSDDVIAGKAGETKWFETEFDISMLSNGVYCARVWLMKVNNYGTRQDYDKPLQNIYFEIECNNSKVNWTSNWGNIVFERLKVVE